ncbi:MAG: SIMPL domain-containing protein [Candidatus Moranbacteria bacterium]|nr:SIMPL domain-containing protein [Candidatus Moranbacteria bacterium]
MQKINALLIGLVVVAVGAVLIVALVTAGKNKEQDRFLVLGSGIVNAKADIANINVGLKTGAKKTAAEATQEATLKMNNIIEALKNLKVDEKDIKTSDYNLNPVYNWTDGKGQELVGYEVAQTLTLKIRDLNNISEVIARTTEQGANQIGNISFTIDDEFALKNQARELAIEKAQEKAAMIAKQSGMKLGSIKNVVENENQDVRPVFANAKMDASASGNAPLPAPSIQTGQNEIRVDVTLTYEVK